MALTLKDILEAIGTGLARVDLFGIEEELELVLESRLTGLYDAIAKECKTRRLTVELSMLPDSTEFYGDDVVRLHARLCEWLESRSQKIETRGDVVAVH